MIVVVYSFITVSDVEGITSRQTEIRALGQVKSSDRWQISWVRWRHPCSSQESTSQLLGRLKCCLTCLSGGAIVQLPCTGHLSHSSPTDCRTRTDIGLLSEILSRIDYCNAVLHGALSCSIKKSQRVQNNAAWIILKATRRSPCQLVAEDDAHSAENWVQSGCADCWRSRSTARRRHHTFIA